jgi:hypothetical protein
MPNPVRYPDCTYIIGYKIERALGSRGRHFKCTVNPEGMFPFTTFQVNEALFIDLKDAQVASASWVDIGDVNMGFFNGCAHAELPSLPYLVTFFF